jgi:hypothetical protein
MSYKIYRRNPCFIRSQKWTVSDTPAMISYALPALAVKIQLVADSRGSCRQGKNCRQFIKIPIESNDWQFFKLSLFST